MQPNDLTRIARQIRLRDLQAVYEAGAGHIGGEMSSIDILTALYFRVLRLWPDQPKHPERDRFVLSKGHVALALYVTLAKRGFFPEAEIATFLKPHSRLNGHPNCNKVPGVETNTGPLGHGLPVAVGMAKAAKLTGATYRTYVMTGDGEMQEGSNWEALMFAAHRKLDNLTMILDLNNLQIDGHVTDVCSLGDIEAKLAAFGWNVQVIDGHDVRAVRLALGKAKGVHGQPQAIVCTTVKGKGVSFMEDKASWHGTAPSHDQAVEALAELDAERARLEKEADNG